MTEFFQDALSHFSAIHGIVIAIGLLLLVFARKILGRFFDEQRNTEEFKRRLIIFRGLNILILLLYVGYIVGLKQLADEQQSWLISAIKIFITLYIAFFAMNLCRYFVLRQYGYARTRDNVTFYNENYETRLISLLINIFIAIITIITIIQELGFDSMLQTGGILGFIGVMLGLTQGAWAPDIISGLILLNSNIWEEGDVVKFSDGEEKIGVIYKTRYFHTELLDMSRNCRIMIKNARVRDFSITNLSKFASAKGYRDCLSFKIGYDVTIAEARNMFEEAMELAESNNIPFEAKFDTEIAINDTGDHAVEWQVFYYVKEVEKILSIRRQIKETIWSVATEKNIDLSTPITLHNK